jgi:transcriptional regulator with XRE-family HTH domain
MGRNVIRAKREAAGLTQRGLAERVGTSQQQIQRIESGVQSTRLDLAVAIAKALDAELSEIFPKLPRTRIRGVRLSEKSKKHQKSMLDDNLIAEGIDPDPRQWTIKVGLRDGETLFYSVSSPEKERVSNIVWSGDFEFVVFETQNKYIALRYEGINFCQFLFDPASTEKEQEEDFDLRVFFSDGGSMKFGVDPDSVDLAEDDDGLGAQLQSFFMNLEADAGDEGVVWFDDEDGERVYIRRKQLLRAELPLVCCRPALWNSYLENIEEPGA